MEIAALAEAHQVAVSEAPLGTHLHPFAPEPPRSPSVDPDVSAVVLRAQQGDTAAFERLVRAHEGELGRLALRMLRDHGEAEDVVQDVFVQAWRRLDHLDDPDAFHGWLYQITTRACLDALRARSRRPLDLTDGSGAAFDASALALDGRRGEGPQDAAQTSAHLRGLAIALADLAPDLRTCWVLKQLHGLSYADIAFATGVPVSTVRGRLVRAREGVRGRMADWR